MNFDNIIGNNEVKAYLETSFENNSILHSYLFLGTEGIGKRQIALEFARALLCLEGGKIGCTCKSCLCFNGQNHPDFVLVEPEGGLIKIDMIRNIIKKSAEKPILSGRKVYIINDFETANLPAQNCLLKTLEEPPKDVVLILISSNDNLIVNTIKSRCMTVKFKNISNDELKEYAIKNIGYEDVSENLLEAFGGSIGKATTMKDKQEKYIEIDNLLSNISKSDIIEIMKSVDILGDKDHKLDVIDNLNYMIVSLYSKSKEEEKYANCIPLVNETIQKLKANGNFKMSIDSMMLTMWEELNEDSNRN